jgi:hypothetical protein
LIFFPYFWLKLTYFHPILGSFSSQNRVKIYNTNGPRCRLPIFPIGKRDLAKLLKFLDEWNCLSQQCKQLGCKELSQVQFL